MENKSTGKTILIIALLLAVIGLGGYIVYDKVLNKENEEPTKTEKQDGKTMGTEKQDSINYLFKFNSSKVLSSNKDLKYSLSQAWSMTGININLGDNQKQIKISVSWNNLVDSNLKKDKYDEFVVNFSKEIEDIYIGTIGQDETGTIALFIMEDGSIEYIPIYSSLQKSEFKSSGQVSNLTNIVKFYTASAWIEDAGGGHITVLAQSTDGTLYNLEDYIKIK